MPNIRFIMGVWCGSKTWSNGCVFDLFNVCESSWLNLLCLRNIVMLLTVWFACTMSCSVYVRERVCQFVVCGLFESCRCLEASTHRAQQNIDHAASYVSILPHSTENGRRKRKTTTTHKTGAIFMRMPKAFHIAYSTFEKKSIKWFIIMCIPFYSRQHHYAPSLSCFYRLFLHFVVWARCLFLPSVPNDIIYTSNFRISPNSIRLFLRLFIRIHLT